MKEIKLSKNTREVNSAYELRYDISSYNLTTEDLIELEQICKDKIFTGEEENDKQCRYTVKAEPVIGDNSDKLCTYSSDSVELLISEFNPKEDVADYDIQFHAYKFRGDELSLSIYLNKNYGYSRFTVRGKDETICHGKYTILKKFFDEKKAFYWRAYTPATRNILSFLNSAAIVFLSFFLIYSYYFAKSYKTFFISLIALLIVLNLSKFFKKFFPSRIIQIKDGIKWYENAVVQAWAGIIITLFGTIIGLFTLIAAIINN